MTPTYPRNDPYEYAEKIVRALTRRYLLETERINLLPVDELNILQGMRDLTEALLEETKAAFLRLARYVYAKSRGLPRTSRAVLRRISAAWVDALFLSYDPVTKTVFTHEVYRKCERLGEAILATGNVEAEIRPFLKSFMRLIRQEAITVTDKAHKDALHDKGAKKVVWLTRKDELRCGFCGLLHGVIFDEDDVPDKPHPNCRCWTEEV